MVVSQGLRAVCCRALAHTPLHIMKEHDQRLTSTINVTTTIDISKTTVRLLEALWRKSMVAGWYSSFNAYNAGVQTDTLFDPGEAAKAVEGCIDYCQERLIKADLSGDTMDPWSWRLSRILSRYLYDIMLLTASCL
jgi:hypothetical protein